MNNYSDYETIKLTANNLASNNVDGTEEEELCKTMVDELKKYSQEHSNFLSSIDLESLEDSLKTANKDYADLQTNASEVASIFENADDYSDGENSGGSNSSYPSGSSGSGSSGGNSNNSNNSSEKDNSKSKDKANDKNKDDKEDEIISGIASIESIVGGIGAKDITDEEKIQKELEEQKLKQQEERLKELEDQKQKIEEERQRIEQEKQRIEQENWQLKQNQEEQEQSKNEENQKQADYERQQQEKLDQLNREKEALESERNKVENEIKLQEEQRRKAQEEARKLQSNNSKNSSSDFIKDLQSGATSASNGASSAGKFTASTKNSTNDKTLDFLDSKKSDLTNDNHEGLTKNNGSNSNSNLFAGSSLDKKIPTVDLEKTKTLKSGLSIGLGLLAATAAGATTKKVLDSKDDGENLKLEDNFSSQNNLTIENDTKNEDYLDEY